MTVERAGIVPRVRELVLREALFSTVDLALLMLSGGQDSLTLLEMLGRRLLGKAGPANLQALHVNHHLRGEESDTDERLVREHCSRLEIRLTVADRPIAKGTGNLMECAREARRSAALDVAREVGAERIVLGHTLDDQVETMLYRLGRYGGLAAFRGMKACDPPWVRPLLTCRRAETADFCVARGLVYAVDRGNAHPGYSRTGVRERVLPAWEAVLPGCVEAAGRAAEVAGEMEELSRWVLGQISSGQAAGPGLSAGGTTGSAPRFPATSAAEDRFAVGQLVSLPPSVRRLVVFDALECLDGVEASRALVLGIERLLSSGGSADLHLGGGWLAHKEYDDLRFERTDPENRPGQARAGTRPAPAQAPLSAVPLAVPGEVEWEGSAIRAEWVESFAAPDPGREAYLDGAVLGTDLTVRGPRPGDRMRPLGSAGSRKLQDILVDLKVPARLRPRVPLVLAGDRIMWVGGMVVAEEGRICRETTRVVRLSLRRAGEGLT